MTRVAMISLIKRGSLVFIPEDLDKSLNTSVWFITKNVKLFTGFGVTELQVTKYLSNPTNHIYKKSFSFSLPSHTIFIIIIFLTEIYSF